MCIFKKKNENNLIMENKRTIQNNAGSLDVLIALAFDAEEMSNLLKDIQEKIKYMNPSAKREVADLDKKIANRIGDIKIEINKSNVSGDYGNAIVLAKDLQRSLIVERNTKANQR